MGSCAVLLPLTVSLQVEFDSSARLGFINFRLEMSSGMPTTIMKSTVKDIRLRPCHHKPSGLVSLSSRFLTLLLRGT